MFCYQCEQTAKGEGCTKLGVCGKVAEVSDLQDLLAYALKGLALYAVEGAKVGVNDPRSNALTCEALFSTLTNVNFDPDRFMSLIPRVVEARESLKAKVRSAGGKVDFTEPAAAFEPEKSLKGMLAQAAKVGLQSETGTRSGHRIP